MRPGPSTVRAVCMRILCSEAILKLVLDEFVVLFVGLHEPVSESDYGCPVRDGSATASAGTSCCLRRSRSDSTPCRSAPDMDRNSPARNRKPRKPITSHPHSPSRWTRDRAPVPARALFQPRRGSRCPLRASAWMMYRLSHKTPGVGKRSLLQVAYTDGRAVVYTDRALRWMHHRRLGLEAEHGVLLAGRIFREIEAAHD